MMYRILSHVNIASQIEQFANILQLFLHLFHLAVIRQPAYQPLSQSKQAKEMVNENLMVSH